jgi:hypothetical protein
MLLTILVDSPRRLSHVIRAASPPRQGTEQDARESLWVLRRRDGPPIRADLVALTDGVEVELFEDDKLRRRWRFITDAAARSWATRLATRLGRRNFTDRRTVSRPKVWLD